MLQNAGETRGLVVILAEALTQGQCYFANSDKHRQLVKVDAKDVDYPTPMLVLWNPQEINREYEGAKKTISCVNLFETREEYFIKVIGRVPDELCPEPHLVLQDYVKYEVKVDADKPRAL
jgi:hypothetical protein